MFVIIERALNVSDNGKTIRIIDPILEPEQEDQT
jgi:hypothetical protein